MDIKVDNRDIAISDSGAPVMIDGLMQVVQQLKLCSIVDKGTFIYDRQMGLEIPTNFYGLENREKILEAMFSEMLINVPGVTVTVNSIYNSLRVKKAMVTVTDGYNTEETEVTIFENI